MPRPESGGFRAIGERERLAGGPIRFVTGTFLDPNGFTFERDIVRHPGAVCIVAFEEDDLIMVRQYRSALDVSLLEIPAGKCDVPGELREVTAARELAEEVGRRAKRLTELGDFYNSPGFSDERSTAFLAEDLVSVDSSAHGLEEEFMTIEKVPRARFWDLVDEGRILDAKTILGVTLAERHLARRLRLSE